MPEAANPKLYDASPIEPPSAVAPCDLDYVELDAVTNFSFLRGASHADELIYTAALLGYRAIAITDVNTLAGIVRAHQAALKPKLKLIVGARLTLVDGPDLLVWMPHRQAYAKLCRLLTLGKRRAEKSQCLLRLADIISHNCDWFIGVDLGSAMRNGHPLPLEDRQFLDTLHDAVGDRLSLATSCLYGADDQSYLHRMMGLSDQTGIALAATNHVHYHDPARRRLQDALVCIRNTCTIDEAGYRLFPNSERYLKSPRQMHRLFADCPQAISRSVWIASQCTFSLAELRYEYPQELVPTGVTAIAHLTDLAQRGAVDRYPDGVPEKVRNSLSHELRLIEQQHFEQYFLTVHDLVIFARGQGILCQGRGSAANSVVCYCLGVTSVNPIEIDLLFERFVSAARNEPPDIDIDFEHERREEVLQYIYQKYGRRRAGMTAEVISYRGRSAVRDIGKALGMSLDIIDEMASRLDWWHRGPMTADQLREVGLDPTDRTVRLIIALTGELLGFPRHLGQHVGGMVMTQGDLCEIVPIENAVMEDRTVIEWDKDDIDALGILKVDCLSLGMLTAISKAFTLMSWHPDAPTALHEIPREDPGVYEMISKADTVGVFQIESRAQMSMLPRLRPNKFYDLVIEVAIVRPGPIQGDMVHPYLRRRNGEEKVEYPSEALKAVLHKTLGVPLFQEQAMKVAMVGAGFSADEADQLRRAMASWRKNGALLKFEPKIINGMLANGYTREFAEQCFNQIKGFGEYGFPESHSASFALLVYASSWIKCYHPAAFCAALLNSQPMGFYAPAQLVRDAQSHGVEARPVDVNRSAWDSLLEDINRMDAGGCKSPPFPQPALRLGFSLIRGMHVDHAARLTEARGEKPFTSINELHRRTKLPVAALRRLAEADAFGSMGFTRRKALWEIMALDDVAAPLFDAIVVRTPDADKTSEVNSAVSRDAQRSGANRLHTFTPSHLHTKDPLRSASRLTAESDAHVVLPPTDIPPVELPLMPLGQEVMTDYATTGLSLKKHPVALIRKTLSSMKAITANEVSRSDAGRWVRVAGLVLIRQRPGTASGIVFETLEDETGVVNLIIRPRVYDRFRPAARFAGLLCCSGWVERQGAVVHVMAAHMTDETHLLGQHDWKSRDFH